MANLHAHVETYATDCDGPISRDYVMTMTDDELAGRDEPNWFGDIDFHNRVTASVVNTYSIFQSGRLEVTSGEGSNFVVRLEWTEATEEGYRSVTATICDDDCDTEETSYRDYRAEEMGY